MDSAKLDELQRQYQQPNAALPSDVTTFQGCVEYFRSEANFWGDKGLGDLGNHFNELRSRLENAQRSDNENDIRNALVDVYSRLAREPRFTMGSKLPRGSFVASLAERDRDAAWSAARYFDGTLQDRGPLNAHAFDGAVAAALFEHPEFANIGLDGRVQEFEREIGRVRSVGQETADSLDAFKRANQEFHVDATERLDALITKATEDFGLRQNSIADEHQKAKAEQEAEMAEIRRNFENLQKSFSEQLSLKEPAKYWKDMKEGYERQSILLGISAIIGVGGLTWFVSNLIYVPPALLTDSTVQYGYIKGALLLGGALSAIIYILNLLVRISTSSLHLSRDARERYQLTRVYLALVAQGAMDEKDRGIILTSLFSRADTGLLKDGAPTITTPLGSVIDKLTGK